MTNYDEDCSVYNGHYEVEVLIDRPVREVWRRFLDIGSWVMSHKIEYIQEAPGAVGSITRVSDKTAEQEGYPPPFYHYCKIIKLVPETHYLLKTYSEKGGSYGLQMTCFDDARLYSVDEKTRVTFNLFCEMRGDAVARDPTAMNLDSSRDGMVKNLNNLKRIVENG